MTTLTNSIAVLLYGWLRHGKVQRRKLSSGLCLAFDPYQSLLTISRLSSVNKYGSAITPPSKKERSTVHAALRDALAVETARLCQDDVYVIDVSNLLAKAGANGKDWYLYRFTWHLPSESEEVKR